MPSPSIKVENLRGKSERTGKLDYQDGHHFLPYYILYHHLNWY